MRKLNKVFCLLATYMLLPLSLISSNYSDFRLPSVQAPADCSETSKSVIFFAGSFTYLYGAEEDDICAPYGPGVLNTIKFPHTDDDTPNIPGRQSPQATVSFGIPFGLDKSASKAIRFNLLTTEEDEFTIGDAKFEVRLTIVRSKPLNKTGYSDLLLPQSEIVSSFVTGYGCYNSYSLTFRIPEDIKMHRKDQLTISIIRRNDNGNYSANVYVPSVEFVYNISECE